MFTARRPIRRLMTRPHNGWTAVRQARSAGGSTYPAERFRPATSPVIYAVRLRAKPITLAGDLAVLYGNGAYFTKEAIERA